MSFPLNLAILVLMLTFCNQVLTASIFGGKEAVPHSRPYMVLLETLNEFNEQIFCCGFLVSEDFVISAAHCYAWYIRANLGVHNVHKGSEQTITVEETFPHPKYSPNYVNDIMLLKLSKKVVFSDHVQPIALPSQWSQMPDECLVSGWGRANVSTSFNSKVLREVNVTVLQEKMCNDKRDLCSLGDNRPAKGDSGSPLVCGNLAFGVVSYYEKKMNSYTSYTRITDYLPWIYEIMNHQ